MPKSPASARNPDDLHEPVADAACDDRQRLNAVRHQHLHHVATDAATTLRWLLAAAAAAAADDDDKQEANDKLIMQKMQVMKKRF